MQTIQVQLPDTVNIDAQEIQLLLAGKLYEKGLLSVGQVAQMAGFSKRAFMELLGHYQVSVLNYPADDILQDFENASDHFKHQLPDYSGQYRPAGYFAKVVSNHSSNRGSGAEIW